MKVFLKKNIKPRIKNGHPWIYDNEIEKIEGNVENGSIVNVFNHEKYFIGKGYLNTNSKIRVRLLTRKNESINKDFIKKRILAAIKRRNTSEKTFRVVFSEADNLPGLIVDKFESYIVIDITTLGMEKLKPYILESLIEIFNPLGIYEKSESSSRIKEGLEKISEWVYGRGPELIPFQINDIKFLADTKGQKTGAFLDQRYNAMILGNFSKNKICLDCFSYTGNFAVHMLRAGAKNVILIDYSKRALEIADEIMKLNKFENYELINANAFDFLKNLDKSSKMFDVISVDPPSFAKSASNKLSALKGYKEINLRAMRLLKDGGILATSSCTQVVSEQEFISTIIAATNDSGKIARTLYRGGQPFDHPIVLNIFETNYLKFFLLEIEKIRY
ncbi:class I SAM-dependent rRNA methyltransferase [Thermosipho ferrireducens]|uniref:Class I SAM-dependent rRNA methyltransferase n=1 Tax=Thermosipho ferrireducens TaxID=2571116 RepID=A0ABX7S853_9BACT|nr:class I SAM-dependent rRNA methyltransferase [Thermosipho ferrireducens]QTA38772.1 class I SAM-dependent rRNA methyltransferase [Thermosipho ferrireducens]